MLVNTESTGTVLAQIIQRGEKLEEGNKKVTLYDITEGPFQLRVSAPVL